MMEWPRSPPPPPPWATDAADGEDEVDPQVGRLHVRPRRKNTSAKKGCADDFLLKGKTGQRQRVPNWKERSAGWNVPKDGGPGPFPGSGAGEREEEENTRVEGARRLQEQERPTASPGWQNDDCTELCFFFCCCFFFFFNCNYIFLYIL